MRAPFRIYRFGAPGIVFQGEPSAQEKLQLYTDRVSRLIPAEIIAAYTAGRGIRPQYVPYWAPICLILLLIIRTWGTRSNGQRPQLGAVAIAAISFVLWTYSLGDYFYGLKISDSAIAAMAMIAWVVVLPVFYKGAP
jgi:hypothetical protein